MEEEIISEAELYVDNYLMREIIQYIRCGCNNCMRLAREYMKTYTFGNFDEEIFDYITKLVKKNKDYKM
ncbi:MAG: hypothetical protein QXF88_01775 [Candidatus Aenigmatarchaeota archaeon]